METLEILTCALASYTVLSAGFLAGFSRMRRGSADKVILNEETRGYISQMEQDIDAELKRMEGFDKLRASEKFHELQGAREAIAQSGFRERDDMDLKELRPAYRARHKYRIGTFTDPKYDHLY